MLAIDLDNLGCQLAVRRAGSSGAAPVQGRQVPHARLGRIAGEWVASSPGDLSGGAFLNGTPLRGSARLQDGDVLRFCGVAVTFTVRERSGTVPGDSYAEVPAVSGAEQRVLEALARPCIAGGGMAAPAANAEIAAELVISVHTVKSHMRRMFGKFGLDGVPQGRKRAALVEAAFRAGVIGRR